jgi:hypothetical protein
MPLNNSERRLLQDAPFKKCEGFDTILTHFKKNVSLNIKEAYVVILFLSGIFYRLIKPLRLNVSQFLVAAAPELLTK